MWDDVLEGETLIAIDSRRVLLLVAMAVGLRFAFRMGGMFV